MLQKSTLDFLKSLEKNNNRDWFTKNKNQFEEAKNDFQNFVQELILGISKFDKSIAGLEAKNCVFRIYRDFRFSKDKKPYKANFGASINRGGRKMPFAGYYIHIQPTESFLGGGMHIPDPDRLQKVRQEILYNTKDFKKIIGSSSFKKYFEKLWEEDKLKIAPKNFPKDHPDIDLLKYKSYIAAHTIKENQVLSKDFLKHCVTVFKELKPMNDFLNAAVSE